jgi:hypothetical protein
MGLGKPVRSRLLALLLATGVALVAVPAQTAMAAAANPVPPSGPAAAQRALADAQALLSPSAERRVSPQTSGRDATLALRELGVHRDELTGADRTAADRLLARPGANRQRDFGSVRVHWGAGSAVTSAYVDRVGATVRRVLATYKAAGYRAPKSDGTRGGGQGKFDVYLQNLGAQGLYGYCTTDEGGVPPSRGPYDTWAYCAFDDNYSEFPAHTPLQNLHVTAAHELFHAVQFAYDYYEDAWFMEATATWAEDEVYDGVDDNVQYLVQSPLTQPGASMDHFSQTGVRQYGDWIFYRYLTERFPHAKGGLPTLVREIWRRADGARGGADDFSIQATGRVLAAHDSSLRAQFARFTAANRRPGSVYEEGRANRYPAAPLAGRATLDNRHRGTGWKGRRVDHLASATYRFARGARLNARALKVRLDLPPAARGSAAVLTVFRASGRPRTTTVPLSAHGNATKRVGFGRGVRSVEVTLVNTSTRYRCGVAPGAGFSCAGRSLDDNLRMLVRARAQR